MFSYFKTKIKKVLTSFTKKSFAIGGKIKSLFTKKIDESSYEMLEELFYEADLGPATSIELVDIVRSCLKKNPTMGTDLILDKIRKHLLDLFSKEPQNDQEITSPHVIMITGVNGSGKTTTVAKLAKIYQDQGKKVLIGACDTFRAAAIDQLALWAKKLNIDIVRSQPNSDPSAVAFDTLSSAKAKGYDVVILDTAGRLQTKTDLMSELEKMSRVCKKVVPQSPHETLLVLDATTGQNALDQMETFHSFVPISGIVLTKLDGSAKGGIVVSIFKKFKIPIKWIGVGEKEGDLMDFDPEEFIDELLSTSH